MKQLVFIDYFPDFPHEMDAMREKLSDLYMRFPASSVVNLFYLKLLQEYDHREFEKMKSKILLSMPNRSLILHSNVILPQLHSESNVIKPQIEPNLKPKNNQVAEPINLPDQPAVHDVENQDQLSMLIDKFTVNPPKMIFDPSRHNPNINYEKETKPEEFELVSETLAMIYADQGYTQKAEKIFKKLALLFPEKNCYFADQIKKIKNKESNQ
ncbi:MAG: hypothetical protein RBS29_08790 [Bacteroidales bacterium]|jgi:hypothetical protein|nr:hypothetical protein [Bacteroidales bacterium]